MKHFVIFSHYSNLAFQAIGLIRVYEQSRQEPIGPPLVKYCTIMDFFVKFLTNGLNISRSQ